LLTNAALRARAAAIQVLPKANATILTVDKAGRVVLPKPVRDQLQLSAGDSLELESSEDRIVLWPVRGAAPAKKEETAMIWLADTSVLVPVFAPGHIYHQESFELFRERMAIVLARDDRMSLTHVGEGLDRKIGMVS
jgi:AbrB family looped-hinge helix DNA binding protein